MSKSPDKSANLQQRYSNIISHLASTLPSSSSKKSTMPDVDLSEVPANLRVIKPYLKTATEHEVRDPVVTYWARIYALQTGIKIGKSPEERGFLVKLMDWLEKFKKENSDNEAITNEVAAQAHLENWILKIFSFADRQDRAGNFTKSVIQSFYTAGILYDILATFGELSEEVLQNRKYAKWKATYIHNCLKNGETPIAGPIENGEGGTPAPQHQAPPQTPPSTDAFGFPAVPNSVSNVTPGSPVPSYPSMPATPSSPGFNPPPQQQPLPDYSTHAQTGNVVLDAEQMSKAQKYIKWAGSACNYDDVPTAVDNLQKALRLLTTGQDS